MDTMRVRKLEEKEALLRDTFEDALLELERNSEISVEHIKLVRSLAVVWMAARQVVECEKKLHPSISPLKLKE